MLHKPGAVIINQMGFEYAGGAFVAVGIIGMIIAAIIYKYGTSWIDIVLPPAAMGSVVALIGFELVGLTIRGGAIGAEILTDNYSTKHLVVFLITVLVAVFGSVLFRKLLATVPILIAIIAGYITAVALGMVDFTPVYEAKLLPRYAGAFPFVTAIKIRVPIPFIKRTIAGFIPKIIGTKTDAPNIAKVC